MAMTPEGKVKKAVTTLLKLHGIWYFFPGNNGLGKSGIPDIICIMPGGIFMGIECKADRTKQPTALQAKCGQDISAAGGGWMVICDDDGIKLLDRLITHRKNTTFDLRQAVRKAIV